MHFLGIDIGTSSIKASVLDGDSGLCLASAHYPEAEAPIISKQAGWAEQEPEIWWANAKAAIKALKNKHAIDLEKIEAIGISYQMHGLVLVDKNMRALRPSIIWCDSRAVEAGERAFKEIGEDKCLTHMLNSPGNFTASKLKWVQENEPDLYKATYKIMLPGDYIAMKLSGEINTTVSGLSEGVFWDFKENSIATMLMEYYGFDKELIPAIVPCFSLQSEVSAVIADEIGFKQGVKISYRAGDQPNNAFSLNVQNPGEVAATAGTSGVVFGVSDTVQSDKRSRVNTFAHVNHTNEINRLGVLLCINGAGSLNSWVKKNIAGNHVSYQQMNEMAAGIAVGAEGLSVLPFGNGAERILENKMIGSHFENLNFNIHSVAHLFRAVQEGIAFSFKYGMDIMHNEAGVNTSVIKAGRNNMFLSDVFCEALSYSSGSAIELYETDGALGAARGAAVGAGYYKNFKEAFGSLKKLATVEPQKYWAVEYAGAYDRWLKILESKIQ